MQMEEVKRCREEIVSRRESTDKAHRETGAEEQTRTADREGTHQKQTRDRKRVARREQALKEREQEAEEHGKTPAQAEKKERDRRQA